MDKRKGRLDEEKYGDPKVYDYTRIRLSDVVNTFESLLTKLREHRLKENIQRSMKLKGELRDHTI